MTVSRLRQELSQSEFIHFAAYYEVKGETEKAELEKVRK
jgi:hypothetical protein|tara:strand:+ start:877 stop:993 length:117 start_codon:yes stop_codon:yes gene_type:complete